VIRALFAVLALSASAAAGAEECGTANRSLMAPFFGTWRDSDGNILSLGLGTLASLGQADHAQGKPPVPAKIIPQGQAANGPEEISLDCASLDASAVRALLEELEEFLTDGIGAPDMSDEEEAIDVVRRRLRHPPYPMLTVHLYEGRDYMILAGDGELLDLSTAEASLALRRYRKAVAHH